MILGFLKQNNRHLVSKTAVAGEKTTRKFVGVGALDDPHINKNISPINQNLKIIHPFLKENKKNKKISKKVLTFSKNSV